MSATTLFLLLNLFLTAMGLSSKAVRFQLRIILSGITGGWLYSKLISPFELWDSDEYSWDHLKEFFKSSNFTYGFLFTAGSFLVFYFGLRLLISRLFHKKIEDWFSKWVKGLPLEKRNIVKKWTLRSFKLGLKMRPITHPLNPHPKEALTLEELDGRLFATGSMIIHASLCAIILHVTIAGFVVFLAIFFLMLMISIIPMLPEIENLLNETFETPSIDELNRDKQ